MNDINYTLAIAGIALLIIGVLVWIFAGEKYMKWQLSGPFFDYRKYDSKRFKILHVTEILFFSILALVMGIFGDVDTDAKCSGTFLLILLSILILHYVLLLTVCRKSSSEYTDKQN